MTVMYETRQFSFQGQELSQKLLENISVNASGYWKHQFDRLSARETAFNWYLGVSDGQIVHSGSTPWSSAVLLRLVQRYVPQARQEPAKSSFTLLQKKVQDNAIAPAELLKQLGQLGIADESQLKAASRLKILSDLDTYLLMGSGNATFVPEVSMASKSHQLLRADAQVLIRGALQRQVLWQQIKQQVPSLNLIPKLNGEAFAQAPLSAVQKQRIQVLVQSGKSINHVAIGLGKDSLEVATMFARLVKTGLIELSVPQKSSPSVIMIIDDSPLVLKQFQHWVTALGYPVVACQNAVAALSTISQVKPATIFIDINMPGISGFELAKQIRQQPEIASIPLVILTGEQKLSNKWRAQWSGCDFLTKPLSLGDIGEFQAQLQDLLQRLAASSGPVAA
ncbi:response regulator [Altericista sp. CCNU0014]|uniref:response regulator n=1 Tax=Altericista sp. CCNU0014 TaxID=3082949 RepID=UPI00384C3CB3